MVEQVSYRRRLFVIFVFAVAMAYFEAAVVVYLRQIFYPGGFGFPLTTMPNRLILIELGREFSTIVMLAAVAAITGKRFWDRFGYFIVMFGVWDILYYVWLKVQIGWPDSLLDWDILFLLPVPWIGPVIAPVLISLLMIFAGVVITRMYSRGIAFRPSLDAWALALLATVAILFSFMRDFGASFHQQMPQPYIYSLLFGGLLLYVGAFLMSYRRSLIRHQVLNNPLDR
jgi:hypothetical protein